jgi:1-deoxy-D-xylulose-5-phosphate reductoisomerase
VDRVSDARRTVTILGATGSEGQSTLDLIERSPERFEVLALTAPSRRGRALPRAPAVVARRAVIAATVLLEPLREALSGSGIEAAAGRGAVIEAASWERLDRWRRSSARRASLP